MQHTINGLLKTRDDMMSDIVVMREQIAKLYNDVMAVDTVLDALGTKAI